MAKIEGFCIKNFKVLEDVTLGKLWNSQAAEPLTPLTAVIGKNGAGKSTLFDAFGFLADCLRLGVEEACDSRGRGGFERILAQGKTGPIEFVVYYKESRNSRPITYELAIDCDGSGRPYVSKERLRQRRSGERYVQPLSFLVLENGKGAAWKGEQGGFSSDEEDEEQAREALTSRQTEERHGVREESKDTERVELSDNRELGITTLGSLKQHPRISAFRRFIQSWYLSYFTPDAARSLPLAGPQKHLNAHGDNLGNVVQFMEREHPEPPQFVCIEEPENGLYHKLLGTLAQGFREHVTGDGSRSQIFVTTYQPYFVNALEPEEVWVLEKGNDGFSKAHRASDDEIVMNMVAEGLPLGDLWHSDYLDAR